MRVPRQKRTSHASRLVLPGRQRLVVRRGGGFKPGQVVGATDRDGAYVKDKEYKLGSLAKTVYHLLGLDPAHELYGTDGRPLKLITEDVPLIKESLP